MSRPSQAIDILRNRAFINFILARFFLTLAIQMQMTTIGLQIYYEYLKNYDTRESAYILGLTGLYEAIPFILTSFFSGHMADKFNRKRLIILSCLALIISSVILGGISAHKIPFLEALGYYGIFCVVILIGVIRAFLSATMAPFMSQLVDRSQYTTSATWNSTVWHIGAISGPVLAALLYGWSDSAETIYFINILLFLCATCCIVIIKYNPPPLEKFGETIWQSLKVGVGFVFKQKILLSALSLDLFAVLFGGAVTILPAFNDKILHASPQAFGILRTAPAVGAVLMAIIMAIKPPNRRAGFWLLIAVVAFGVFTIGFALCTSYWLAFIMLLFTGAFDNISVVVRHSVLQLMTPDNMRGRVSAVNSIFIGSSNEIGGFESGVAARIMGLVPSIIFGGGMTILVVAIVDRLNPRLKKLDLTKM
jgi:MFS family permease